MSPLAVCARRLQANAYVKRFLSGKMRSRVQFKEELALVTEFEEEIELVEKDCEITSPVEKMGSMMKDHLRAFDQCMSPRGDLSSLFDDSRDSWDSFLTDDSPSTGSFSKRTKKLQNRHKVTEKQTSTE
jgi:hypothetical protein